MILADAKSDTGPGRSGNEDSFLCLPERGIFAVADGLGGLAYGEVASRLVVDMVEAASEADFENLAGLMTNLCAAVEEKSLTLGSRMGTTLTLAVLRGGLLRVAHVGDSAAFLVAPDGSLAKLTDDHTMAAEYRRTDREWEVEPYMEDILTQCVGLDITFEPQILERDFPPGSRLVLATDGISKIIPRTEIGELVVRAASPESAAIELVRRTRAYVGLDDATVVILFDVPGAS
jgi:protein phosphatase